MRRFEGVLKQLVCSKQADASVEPQDGIGVARWRDLLGPLEMLDGVLERGERAMPSRSHATPWW
jgi:hypothetical protein